MFWTETLRFCGTNLCFSQKGQSLSMIVQGSWVGGVLGSPLGFRLDQWCHVRPGKHPQPTHHQHLVTSAATLHPPAAIVDSPGHLRSSSPVNAVSTASGKQDLLCRWPVVRSEEVTDVTTWLPRDDSGPVRCWTQLRSWSILVRTWLDIALFIWCCKRQK